MSKRQYGIMPPFPELVVMMRGSQVGSLTAATCHRQSAVAINRTSP